MRDGIWLTSYLRWRAWSLHVNVCWLFAGPDLLSPSALYEISVRLCAGASGLHKLLWQVPGHMSTCSTPFSEISQKREKSQIPCFPLFSLKCSILLLPKKNVRRLLDVEDSSFPGTFAAYRGYTFIQRNGSNEFPRSLKAETSAGMICRLLAELSSVK